ncbi:hypothetical protein MUP32_04930, partial [Candidatus Microgenomates bacterium]|nr:hypothetical protein [Candidatus Microgenomates bacterium]
GVKGGIVDSGGTMSDYFSRNNILQMSSSGNPSVRDSTKSSSNDYNYDFYNGKITASSNAEQNGITFTNPGFAVQSFDRATGKGSFYLNSTSGGFDKAVLLPNFNDGYTGTAPDMGAHEANTPPMEFGVNAYLTVSSSPTPFSCPLASLGDFNCDGKINESDLNALLEKWMTGEKDITGDGKTNESDLNKLLGNWKTL